MNSGTKPEYVLEVKDLSVVYKGVIRALDGVSFKVQRGSIVALLGANGAGKSTIMRAVTGMLGWMGGELTGGQVMHEGELINDITPQSIVRRGVAQVMEGRQILPHLTVDQNLRIGTNIIHSKTERKQLIERSYEFFPKLKALKNTVSGYLSGGEQQMMLIGRALVARPKLILLDEPSLGMAPLIVEQIFEMIKKLQRDLDLSFLIVEQNANLVLASADYAYVLETGSIKLEGVAAKLREDPQVREVYLGRG